MLTIVSNIDRQQGLGWVTKVSVNRNFNINSIYCYLKKITIFCRNQIIEFRTNFFIIYRATLGQFKYIKKPL